MSFTNAQNYLENVNKAPFSWLFSYAKNYLEVVDKSYKKLDTKIMQIILFLSEERTSLFAIRRRQHWKKSFVRSFSRQKSAARIRTGLLTLETPLKATNVKAGKSAARFAWGLGNSIWAIFKFFSNVSILVQIIIK